MWGHSKQARATSEKFPHNRHTARRKGRRALPILSLPPSRRLCHRRPAPAQSVAGECAPPPHPPHRRPQAPDTYVTDTGDAAHCDATIPLAAAAADVQFWSLLADADPSAARKNASVTFALRNPGSAQRQAGGVWRAPVTRVASPLGSARYKGGEGQIDGAPRSEEHPIWAPSRLDLPLPLGGRLVANRRGSDWQPGRRGQGAGACLRHTSDTPPTHLRHTSDTPPRHTLSDTPPTRLRDATPAGHGRPAEA